MGKDGAVISAVNDSSSVLSVCGKSAAAGVMMRATNFGGRVAMNQVNKPSSHLPSAQ